MKVKINEKWFEGRYNDERKFIIPLSEEQDIIFFYKWEKKSNGKIPKSDYVKDVEYKTICESGTLINCYPILNLNEDGVWLKFDSYKTIEGYNKEQQELLDEAYENYESRQINMYIPIWSQEKFINKCKTDTEFSEKWGLKIEERELSEDEGNEIRDMQYFKNNLHQALKGSDTKIDWENIPTKLITITYNDKTIESYE
jgi:hypothetical protein